MRRVRVLQRMHSLEGRCGMRAIQKPMLLLSAALLSACDGGAGGIDTGPIGGGLQFIGISLVLCALVMVFGKFIGGGK